MCQRIALKWVVRCLGVAVCVATESAMASSCPADRLFFGGFQPVLPVLSFGVQPSDAAVNAFISPAVTVVSLDDAHCAPMAGQSVVIAPATADTGGVFGTLTELTDASGAAMFADLSIDSAGTDTLVATAVTAADGVGTATSASFNETGSGACTRQVCNLVSGCTQVNLVACATPYCSLAGADGPSDPNFDTCNSANAWQDTDGDGLSDAAEIQGYIDVNCNGVYDPGIDIALPGADPNVPDIYLHYDYVDAGTHNHNPPQAAVDMVVAAFAVHGVNLHIDPVHNAIPEAQAKVVTLLTDTADPMCTGPSAMTMHQLEEQYLPVASPAFHYIVFGHWSSCDNVADCLHCPVDPECGGGVPPGFGNLGSSEIIGNDAIVSLGFLVDADVPIPIETWAGVMMHELGHNLGLLHGGLDCDNYKPNYVSVMSYGFYTTGIPIGTNPGDATPAACTVDADCPLASVPDAHCSIITNTCYRIDYSSQAFQNLDEAGGLDETVGIRLSGGTTDTTDRQITTWFGPDGVTQYLAPTNGAPIDWDLSGSAASTAATADINGDGSFTNLTTQFDWEKVSGKLSKLTLPFQCNPNYDH